MWLTDTFINSLAQEADSEEQRCYQRPGHKLTNSWTDAEARKKILSYLSSEDGVPGN